MATAILALQPAPADPPFLDLSVREKEALHMLYEGLDIGDIASATDSTSVAIVAVFNRARKREHCSSLMRLVIRYMDEYLGVGQRWNPVSRSEPAIGMPELPLKRRQRAATNP